jgi:hypothetical protein
MANIKFDFSGWATKHNIKCTDGRTILKGAFKDCNGQKVPLVWQHLHNEPGNVLGHAVLEDREEGVYAYCCFNDTPAGKNGKLLVQHGDVTALSIYANELSQQGKSVIHGIIRELSIVLAGANPGAVIDNLAIAHSDGTETLIDDEAIIHLGELDLAHADKSVVPTSEEDETVGDVFETLSPKQKDAVYALFAQVLEGESSGGSSNVTHTSLNEGEQLMKSNVFDNGTQNTGSARQSLTPEQFQEIMSDALKEGSFRKSFLAHAGTYGIDNIEYLFPDAKTVTNEPVMISRRMAWVAGVINGTHHSPFSRIKSLAADITVETARARGYVKGTLKKDEVFGLLKRVTSPTTIYKKQKLDRDDVVDITDLDTVSWMKKEMRIMLDEEIARAVLVGDGREADDPDKVSQSNIRPIYLDDDLYAHKVQIAGTSTSISDQIDAIIGSRKYYFGSGEPALYTTNEFLTAMLLLKDTTGRRIYSTKAELMAALNVSDIIEVPVMSGLIRDTGTGATLKHWTLCAILVNLADYTLGADKGGETSMFEDFDIDYNQQKYLLEGRMSGALVLPKSALVIEKESASG